MRMTQSVLVAFVIALGLIAAASAEEKKKDEQPKKETPAVLKFKVKDIDGKEVDLSTYAGKTILIVNVASKCGYTPQYAGLQKLHEQFSEKGLVILGFPCNQFGGQEPGSEKEIKEFCSANYGVKFPMFSKVDVKGENKSALYKLLTDKSKTPVSQGEIRWNFEKFLIDANGTVVKHYRSKDKPEEIAKDVQKVMAGEKLESPKEPEGDGKKDAKKDS